MKHLNVKLMALTVLMSMVGAKALADTFTVNGIKYQTINASTVKVVANASSPTYSGDIDIPSSVTYDATTYSVTGIGIYAFYYCKDLTSVTIPNSVTSVGENAFENCTGLTSIEIPNSVTSIGDYAFHGCSSLPSITIPNSVTSIGKSAFRGCLGLTSMTIGNSVKSIGDEAFAYCYGLPSITIPKSVTRIGSQAFSGFRSTSIVVEDGNTVYDSREGCNAIIKTSTNTLILGCNSTAIPNSVTSIDSYAFYACTGLTTIEIPNSVTSIGDYAFSITGLTSVTIPNSVTSIGEYAFDYCEDLTSVTISNGVMIIGNYTFTECENLTSVTIPISVTSIGNYAFRKCENLTSIYCYAPSAELGYGAFKDNGYPRKIYVLSDRVDYYKGATNWSSYASYIEPIPDPAALTTASAEDANWSTYYNDNANVQVDDNTTVYKVALDGSSITLTDTGSKIIKAGEAVVLSSTTSGITLAYTSTASTGDYTSNSLLGSNEAVTQEDGYTYYALANLTKGLGFYKVSSSINIPANKAYLRVASGESRDFYGIDEETTGLNDVRSKMSEIRSDVFFDLQGRRVTQPTKGLYIVNGKKVIIK